MTTNITIVGLGKIGGSIGLGLAEYTNLVHRVGHDLEIRVSKQAEKIGAIDKTAINLIQAVENAHLVILAIPLAEVYATLQAIRQDLPEGVVVMDTCPAKQQVTGWIKETLPDGRYYVGLTPAINPIYLTDFTRGLDGAKADLFHNSVMAITAPPGTPPEAIKLGLDLINLLGATPLFSDALEVDGLLATTRILPQLLSAAYLRATLKKPGWVEANKFSGKDFYGLASLVASDTLAAALANKDNTTRLLNTIIEELVNLRDDLDQADQKTLEKEFSKLLDEIETWHQERNSVQWIQEGRSPAYAEIPSMSERFGRMIGFGRKKKK